MRRDSRLRFLSGLTLASRPRCRAAAFLLAAVVGMAALPALRASAADGPVSFNRDVRPILSGVCFQCHGPDAATRKAELRLDQEAAPFEGKHPVIVRGKPDESELVRRILSTDDNEVMPPPETKKPLTAAQKDILRRWVEQGAKYQKHWAFEPIERPAVPAESKAGHPIDAFLNARIGQAGLKPLPAADRETLIRRVAIALTGLPPTLKELDEYLADDKPGAYERMVDRYLASPRYGEEMTKHWLDVARYADTHGLHLDNERLMWAYRDWVVKAFNENLPFDQFTIWQVAGDLLPNATPDQLVATGFNRCNVTTGEGGSIESEWIYRNAVERTTAVTQAWLGLTAGCAVCHDHKYDPLTSKEFYGLYSFFLSSADPALDGNVSTTAPFYKLPTDMLKSSADSAGRVEREARAWLETLANQTSYTDPSQVMGEQPRKAIRDVLIDDVFPIGSTSRSTSRNAVAWVTDSKVQAASGRRVIRQAFTAPFTDHVEFKLRPVIVPHDGVIEASVRIDPVETPKLITFAVTGGKSIAWNATEGGLKRDGETAVSIRPGEWTKLSITAADLGLKPGDRINGFSFGQNGGITYWDAIGIAGNADAAVDPLESFSAWRRTIGATAPPELPGELHGALKADAAKPLEGKEGEALRQFYLAIVARPASKELASARAAWESARAARIIAEESAPGSMIFRDLQQPRDSFVMLRGQYDRPGDKVEPGIPAALPGIRKPTPETRLTRLDLAKWLVAQENPLTARVTANRLWQQMFGTGLVKTSYDFGSQGEPPTHPELLDWLASELKGSSAASFPGTPASPGGIPPWDVKRFMKLLVTSEAFQRESKSTPEFRTADPHNRLYVRGPRFRLDAEQARDNALYVSGLIDLTMGGRGVNPYQPPNIWEPVGYSDSNTRYYLQDHGSALYRRSLYVFLKRTAPPPFMSNFDAPNREQVCTVRERSNTPLQALQLMNDVQHFEAARALAERILSDGGSTDADRIVTLYRTILSRRPDAAEQQLVASALEQQRSIFRSDAAAAKKVVDSGESKAKRVAPDDETAAWTMMANLVLNLDETVNRN